MKLKDLLFEAAPVAKPEGFVRQGDVKAWLEDYAKAQGETLNDLFKKLEHRQASGTRGQNPHKGLTLKFVEVIAGEKDIELRVEVQDKRKNVVANVSMYGKFDRSGDSKYSRMAVRDFVKS